MPSTTAPTTAAAPGANDATVAAAAASSGTLPVTGTTPLGIVLAGALLLVTGALLAVRARRRPATVVER